MIAKSLIVVCAVFGVVAGSCVEFLAPQKTSMVSVPVTKTLYASEPCFSTPVASETVSSGSNYFPVSSNTVLSAPVVTEKVVTGPAMSFPVVSENVMSNQVVSGPVFNEDVFSSGSTFTPVLSSGDSSFSSDSLEGALEKAFEQEASASLPVVQVPPVTFPTVESPMVTLSAPAVPAPRVLSSRCVCTKTIVRPQLYQRVVTVPRVQRYLKRTVTPVVENLVYKSRPVSSSSNSDSESGNNQVVFSGSSSSPLFVSESSCSRSC